MFYPILAGARDAWVLERRGPKNRLDPRRPYAQLWEEECGADGQLVSTATIFLTNRECPFRCLMCDLWRNTLDQRITPGKIPEQIRSALAQLPPARQVKLYNSGNFFDPQAIPPEDDQDIAETVAHFERVIVECHPAFLNGQSAGRCLRFRDSISGKLEVAIGLETAHPKVLEKLNKRMTIDSFRRAALFLKENQIDLRVFILLRPPFLDEAEGLEWACRSIHLAIECGASACSIIPTRGGNGAIDALGESYCPPKLRSLEKAVECGLSLKKARIFADLWDVERFYDCECSPQRAARLAEINLTQQLTEHIHCSC